MAADPIDVLIVGAGISGIGAAWHLKTLCPGKSFAIVERRSALGGTWDLFRYPGIRSDSDMYTLGYSFKPWTEAKAIADGPSILKYLKETAREHDIERHIRFNTRLTAASWSSTDAMWTVTLEEAREGAATTTSTMRCRFLYMCTGYYSYDDPERPRFPDEEIYQGTIVHPQFWPRDLDYAGKRVVVIGSGATAVTLVPAMTDKAGHVTMLQRSPSYVVSRPAEDRLANRLRAILPAELAYKLIRWRNVLWQQSIFRTARKRPAMVKKKLIGMVEDELGRDYDVTTHFTPKYNPWDQRLCLVPDSDLFAAIRSGKADVVTDHIERFTPKGIMLASGMELQCDIIVAATGLKMEVMSGVALTVDGRAIRLADTISYKGFMYSDIPNLASSFGYSNASWTLKSDLIATYVCRLLNHMDAVGADSATPHQDGIRPMAESLMNLSSGYVQRALDRLPKQSDREPWRVHHNYLVDRKHLLKGPVTDAMVFGKAGMQVVADAEELAEAAE